MGHLNGGKLKGSHTTVMDAADELVKHLKGLDEVKGIGLNIIEHFKGKSPPRVIVWHEPTATILKVVFGGTSQQMTLYFNRMEDQKGVTGLIKAFLGRSKPKKCRWDVEVR